MKNVSPSTEKATLGYKVVAGKNPQNTSETILHGKIVNKEVYDISRCLGFAMENGYVQGGQFYSNYGVVNGFFEAVQRLGKDGKDILLNGWLRIHPELKGRIDPETRAIGEQNEIHVCANCQKNLRRKASEFNWECVDDRSVRATVQHIQSVGGEKDKEIFAPAKITVGGTNLKYNASTDRIVASWQTTDAETGETTDYSAVLVPESSGYSAMVLPFPEGLASAPLGTEVTFTFFLRQGNASASVIPATAKAKLVAAA